jgi:predicted branched-subunit amino acid permease
VAAQLTIDESTAMASSQDEPDLRRLAFWATGLSVYVFWNLGTLVGAIAGSAIDPTKYGLDAAIPSAFVALLWPHLRTTNGRRAAAIGAILCLATTPFLPIGLPILVAASAIFIGLPTPSPAPPPTPPPAPHPDATGATR